MFYEFPEDLNLVSSFTSWDPKETFLLDLLVVLFFLDCIVPEKLQTWQIHLNLLSTIFFTKYPLDDTVTENMVCSVSGGKMCPFQ